MPNQKNFNDLNRYLIRRYGSRVDKICLDGGFSCPNRDGTVAYGGCIFCGSEGAGEFNEHGDVENQVRHFLRDHDEDENPKSNLFIAYFQSFSGTYAPTAVLKQRYDAALCDPRIVCLAVGTRPDCISRETVALLASYRGVRDVWVELGLQTSSDETAHRINRGYPSSVFAGTAKQLHEAGIDVIAHIIVGLPGEDHEDIAHTVEFLNTLPISGIKIHSLYVMEGTALGEDYKNGLYTPITMETYIDEVIWILEHLRPDIVIHRLTGDCPRRLHLAPAWALRKRRVLGTIETRMRRENRHQGSLFGGNHGTNTPL